MAVIGIDLGTTNSLVSIWQEGESIIIPNALGEAMTPSIVSYDPDNNDVLVGKAAKNRLISHPELTIATFKRHMGANAEFTLGNKSFKSEELSALLLKQLIEDAETYLGEDIEEIVISVPAYFSDAQRNSTKIAGELAGCKVERLVNEPTAAALSYGFHENLQEEMFLVIDLGGGTLDVSILDIFEDIIEVRASAGDNFFGGEDFTHSLKQLFLSANKIKEEKLSRIEKSRLHHQIEVLKHELSRAREATLAINLKNKDFEWNVTRKEFETAIAPLIKRFNQPIQRALSDSRIEISELDKVILVGGATRMPWVRSEVSRLFRILPTSHIDPDTVVARGASVQAALKARHADLKDVVLTDVCPYTLGVGVVVERGSSHESGHFLPIIERNMTVPVSREQRLHTVVDNQEMIACDIFQGESRLTKNNIQIGRIETNVPKDKAGNQYIDIRFTYDINGILEVILKVGATGENKRVIINNTAANLSAEEIESSFKKLEEIKIHPRENTRNREIISRLERLYEEHIGDMRAYIASVLNEFETILNTQEQSTIDRAQNDVLDILKQIDR